MNTEKTFCVTRFIWICLIHYILHVFPIVVNYSFEFENTCNRDNILDCTKSNIIWRIEMFCLLCNKCIIVSDYLNVAVLKNNWKKSFIRRNIVCQRKSWDYRREQCSMQWLNSFVKIKKNFKAEQINLQDMSLFKT